MLEDFFKYLGPSLLTLSTDRTHEPVQVSQMPSLQAYKKQQKLAVDEQKGKKITDQLLLEEKSIQNLKIRMFKNDFMLNFTENPFSAQKTHNQASNQQNNTEEKRSIRETFQKSTSDYNKSEPNSTNIVFARDQLLNRMPQLTNKNEGIVMKKIGDEYVTIFKQLNPKISNIEESNTNFCRNFDQQRKQPAKISSPEISLEAIVNMKDTNFYQTKQEINNIFYLVFRRDNEITMGNHILDQYYFCQDSTKETPRKNQLSSYRQISTFSRKVMRNVSVMEDRYRILQPRETTLDNDNYTFPTLLSIASGRSRPEDVYLMLMEDLTMKQLRQEGESSQNGSQNQIFYRDKTCNASTMRQYSQLIKGQAQQFRHQPLTPFEVKCKADLQLILKRISATISQIHTIIKTNVHDHKTVEKLQKVKEDDISTLFALNKKKYRNQDQRIRSNKIKKDRTEEIKIKYCTAAADKEKQHQTLIGKQKKKIKNRA